MSERGQTWDDGQRSGGSRQAIRLLVVLSVLLVIAVVIWLLSGDDSEQPKTPEAVTPAALSEVADGRDTPVYWAGEDPAATLELSESEGGRIYVRYLTDGATANDPRADFLTVGTYEFAQPIPAIEQLGNQFNGTKRRIPNGGVAYFNRDDPQNIYLAYPGEEVQIEVYDPDPKEALRLVTEGKIVPVG